ncbi:MAG: gamma-glutamylcyclotransferase, partial [bacterium]
GRGESRENVMRKSNLIQVGLAEMSQGEIYACGNGAYPGLVQNRERGLRPVIGDLWSYSGGLAASHLHEIDTIEGHLSPGLRQTVKIIQAKIADSISPDEACREMQLELEAMRTQSLYRRIFTDVGFGSRTRECWTYVFNRDTTGLHRIESGNWRDYCGRWHIFVQKLAFDFIERQGGLENARTALNRVMYAPDFNSFEDLVEKIKNGQIDERDMIRAKNR